MVQTRGKKINYHAESDIEDEDRERFDGDSQQVSTKTRKPKQRKTASEPGGATSSNSAGASSKGKAPARRTGKLRDLMNMPVDVFTEICHNLGPKDLRSMSLTSRRLRDILMSKDSRHIWKAVLAQEDGLPDCPPELSEPKYVALLFGIHCFDCGSRFGTRVDFFHFVRYCSACADKNMMTAGSARTCWPSAVPYIYFQQQFCAEVHGQIYLLLHGRTRKKETPILRESFNYFISRYQELNADPNETESLKEYVAGNEARYSQRKMAAITIFEWNNRRLSDRGAEITEMKRARVNDIRRKLIDLGWEGEDMPKYNREFDALIKKPQRLTDKVWNNLRPKLIPFMEAGREDRLKREKLDRRYNRQRFMREQYRDFMKDQLHDLPKLLQSEVPKTEALFLLPFVKTLLEEDTETIHLSQWDAIAPEIADFALAHLEARLTTIAKVCGCSDSVVGASPLARIRSMSEALERASSVAWCGSCRFSLHFRNIWSHIRVMHDGKTESFVESSSKNLQQLVVKALKDCGLDESSTKLSDIRNISSFSCTRCDPRVGRTGTIEQLMDHWMFVLEWYEGAVVEGAEQRLAYLKDSIQSGHEPADIFNDHAWEDADPLMKQLTSVEVADQEAARRSFKQEALLHPKSYDENHIGQQALRVCKLCPAGFSPTPCLAPYLEIHVRAKHRVEDFDIEDVSERSPDSIGPRKPCPN